MAARTLTKRMFASLRSPTNGRCPIRLSAWQMQKTPNNVPSEKRGAATAMDFSPELQSPSAPLAPLPALSRKVSYPPRTEGHPPQPQQQWQQLSIKSQAYSPEYYKSIGRIMRWRQRYIADRCIFVHHDEMKELLRGLGARDEDFARLELVSEHLYADPTLPFRKSRNGRFCIDFDTRSVRRLEFQPFALSVEEDFKRHDSDTVRVFDEIEDELQLNSVLQALMAFKAIMVHGVATQHRPKMDYTGNKWVCTLFNVRTITRPDLLGEPALEGVHTDGVDHTMTTFLGSKNMAPNSAVTLLHDPSETTGISFDQVSPSKIHYRAQHRNFLDTMLVTDREYKHSLSALYPLDSSVESTRDMLVFFTRKPVTQDHISASIDSLRPHKGMPMEVPIFIPESKQ